MSYQQLAIQDSWLTKPTALTTKSQSDFSIYEAKLTKLKRTVLWSGPVFAGISSIPLLFLGFYDMILIMAPISAIVSCATTIDILAPKATAIRQEMVSEIILSKVQETTKPFEEWDELFAPFHTKNAQRVLDMMES